MEAAAVVIGGGFVLGILVGRWWAFVPAAGLGAWISQTTEIEAVPGWYLGLVYAFFGATGIAAGVLVRRRLARRPLIRRRRVDGRSASRPFRTRPGV
jgi:hypothetical protein